MSKADKMFEDLGYKKIDKEDYIEFYRNNDDTVSDDIDQIIFAKYEINNFYGVNGDFKTHYFTMQELQAINEKCKELKWIE